MKQTSAGKRLAGVCSWEGSSSLMEQVRASSNRHGGEVVSLPAKADKHFLAEMEVEQHAGRAFTVPPHRITPKRGTLGPSNSTRR